MDLPHPYIQFSKYLNYRINEIRKECRKFPKDDQNVKTAYDHCVKLFKSIFNVDNSLEYSLFQSYISILFVFFDDVTLWLLNWKEMITPRITLTEEEMIHMKQEMIHMKQEMIHMKQEMIHMQKADMLSHFLKQSVHYLTPVDIDDLMFFYSIKST